MNWGTKVKTTKLAIEKNIFSNHRTGVFLGYSKYELSIIVVCENQVTPQRYAACFWVETNE